MTITSQDGTLYQYLANGSTSAFLYPFTTFGLDDLTITLTDPDTLVDTTQTRTTHYTVNLISGANPLATSDDYPLTSVYITFIAKPSSGTIVTMRRRTPRTQKTDYGENDPFPAETHEAALDKLTAIAQELDESVSAAFKYTNADAYSGYSVFMPTPAADEFLGWNGDGDALENKSALDLTGTVIPSMTGNGSRYVRINAAGNNFEYRAPQTVWADLGFSDQGELTIATGAVTVTGHFHTLDTQSNASTDDLDTISGGYDGQIVVFRIEADARNVVIKHNTGNIYLRDGLDCTLDIRQQTITLWYDGELTKWLEIARTPSPGTLLNVQHLTSGTTYTKTTGANMIIVEAVGGGGGGGAASTDAKIGGGGAAGGYSFKKITSPSATYPYAIGAAGAASSGAAGGTGGNTTFNTTTVVANGGAGGAQNGGSFAAGGTASGGDINISGSVGGGGGANTTSANGTGASSPFGRGGFHGIPGSGGQAGVGYGAGGGGGHRDTTSTREGAAGMQGYIRVWEFA